MRYSFIIFLFFGIMSAQNSSFNAEDININTLISGTLLTPETSNNLPLVIIIADSGPVDRNGNQQMMKNNSLKFLAEGLYKKEIASFRYDKRIVKQMKRGTLNEKDINFSDFIKDADAIFDYFSKDQRFSEIYILGHGQGSLVGMVTAQKGAKGFISVAGAGQEIDDVTVAQLDRQSPGLSNNARESFDDLRVNGVAFNYSPGLASIFRKDLQPFIFSWMQYDPKEEIVKLEMPALIISGDKDLQVDISEAEILKDSKPESEYLIIKNMNHIFKKINGGSLENSKSYNQYNLPVMPELIDAIKKFID